MLVGTSWQIRAPPPVRWCSEFTSDAQVRACINLHMRSQHRTVRPGQATQVPPAWNMGIWIPMTSQT